MDLTPEQKERLIYIGVWQTNRIADAKAHILIPIVQERIEICEKLSGEYAEELYQQILAGK